MTIPAVVLGVGLVTAALVCAVLVRWPGLEPGALHLRTELIRRELQLHPWLAGFLRRRRPDPGATVSLLLVVAVSVIALAAAVVGIILLMVWSETGLARSDLPLAEWAAEEASAGSTEFLHAVTDLGGTPAVVLISIAVAAATVRERARLAVMGFLVITIGGQFTLVNSIKWIVDRARPDIDQLAGFASPSFPSGHAAAAAACYACFALLLGFRRSRRTRVLLMSVAAGIAGSVATTRVLLGVHWFTDVIAGLVVGWAWLALCSTAFGGRLLLFGAPVEKGQSPSSLISPSPISSSPGSSPQPVAIPPNTSDRAIRATAGRR